MKGPGGMPCWLTVALLIFPALAFGREMSVQGRDERTVLRIERGWLRAFSRARLCNSRSNPGR
jgi:hypothetical protein